MKHYEVIFPENKKIDIRFGKFEIKTDQSIENEGDETAPEPFDLFLASIGACAGIYAKSFCDARKIDTQGMIIDMAVNKEDNQPLITEINMTLYVTHEFPDKYHAAVIKAMNSCTVKNQLHPDIPFTTRVMPLTD